MLPATVTDNRWKGEAITMTTLVLKMMATSHLSFVTSFSRDALLVVDYWYLHDTGVARIMLLNQDGQKVWLSLPPQCGDTNTPGVCEGAITGQRPSSRTVICSCVQRGKWGYLPESKKMTSGMPLMRVFLHKLSVTDFMRMPLGALHTQGDVCVHAPAQCSIIDSCQRTPELTDLQLTPCFLHRWQQEHMGQTWQILESKRTFCCLQQHLVLQLVSDGLGHVLGRNQKDYHLC